MLKINTHNITLTRTTAVYIILYVYLPVCFHKKKFNLLEFYEKVNTILKLKYQRFGQNKNVISVFSYEYKY